MTHLMIMRASTQRVRLLTVVTFTLGLLFALSAQRAHAEYYGIPTITAFQANTGELLTYSAPEYSGEKGVPRKTYDSMEAGTSPSVTGASGQGYEYVVAFHAAGSKLLWTYSSLYGATGGASTGLGMEPGTSPSIAASGRDYIVAFNALGSGHLWIYESCSNAREHGCATSAYETPLGMERGTSPSIASTSEGDIVAFHAAGSGRLWFYNTRTRASQETNQGLEPGTNPAVTGVAGGDFEAAFHAAGVGCLYLYSSSNGPASTGLGMEPHTSPSIANLNGGWKAAFHASDTGYLWTYESSGVGTNTYDGMSPGTSPSISPRPNNSNDEIAIQAIGGNLFTEQYPRIENSGQGMLAGTSPSISG
jgi:hypothetical protein